MNAVGTISKLLKDLEIEFELKEEQKSIIKAIINRVDDFCRFNHVHFRIKYRPKEFATSCLKVICIWKWPPIWQDWSQLISTSENRVKARNATVFSPFTLRSKAIFIHPFSDFSVTTRIVRLGITSGSRLRLQRVGTDGPRKTEVNNR